MAKTEALKIILNDNLPKSTMIDNKEILSFGNHKLILEFKGLF